MCSQTAWLKQMAMFIVKNKGFLEGKKNGQTPQSHLEKRNMFARKIIVDKQFKHILSARFGSWCTAAKSGLSTQASSIVFYTLHKNTFLWTWSWRVMNGRLLLCSACYSLGSGSVASHFWKVLDFLNPAVMDMDFFSPLSHISITSRFLELYRNLKESFF